MCRIITGYTFCIVEDNDRSTHYRHSESRGVSATAKLFCRSILVDLERSATVQFSATSKL